MTPRPHVSSPRRRRALLWAVGLAVLGIVAAGCVPPPPAPPQPLPPTSFGAAHPVATRQANFVDSSRSTPAYGSFGGTPWRSLPTTIWYPSDGGGPYPLVVFVPGYGVTPSYYSHLLTRIAASGYVVAAATYPLLSGQPAGPTEDDWNDLPPDTWFVTSSVLDLSASGDPAIGGLVDPQRIAVAGHSDGGAVAFQDGFTPSMLDWRVRAVVSYAADVSYYGPYQPNGRPILHVLSDQDVYNPYGAAIAWDRSSLAQPRTIMSLWNASHEGPFTDPDDPHFEVVVRETLGFLDANLKNRPESQYFAGLYVGDRPNLASLEG
jgi:dienelactone hydrolase